MDYTTEDGDAIGGKDFESSHGTLRFEPGITSKTISIRIIDDQLYEVTIFSYRMSNNVIQSVFLFVFV